MILLDNIGKAFAKGWAVRNLSLDIKAGEIFGLLGPNGAGKTTVIKMMIGLLLPDEGNISVSGYDISREPVRVKSIAGYVPDRAFLYERLTAREFLFFVSAIRGIERPEAQDRVEEMLGIFGLSDVADELAGSYSQGMKQRLLFASALIHRPRVVLIDEPFAGLDPFGVRLLKDIIKELSIKGVTIFLATHNLYIAGELCSRTGMINKGRLITIMGKDEIPDVEGGLEGLFLRQFQGGK